MTRLLIALTLIAGCKDKAKDQPKPEPSGSGSATTPVDAAAKPVAKYATPDAKLQRFNECWDAYNNAKQDVYASCFAPDAVREQVDSVPDLVSQGSGKILEMAKAQKTAFPDLKVTPQLVIVSGNDVAAILHIGGTNTGEAEGMKATGKKLGMYEAELATMGDDGMITKDHFYSDQPTQFHQLGLLKNDTSPAALDKPTTPAETLISKADPAEAANKAVIEKLVEAINKKDGKAIEGLLADDFKLTYHGDKTKVENKKAGIKWFGDTLKTTKDGFVDIKNAWTAGDHVVIADVFTGTPSEEITGKGGEARKIETHIVQFFTVKDGKIAQQQIFANRLKTAVELGIVDPDQLMKTLSKAGK